MPTPQRIAILKPSALGDIAHALPVLSALRRLYPAASITWVVNKAFEPMLKGHPHLTDTLAFDRGAFRKGVGASMRYSLGFASTLRKQRFDLVLDLQGLLRTGLMCASTGAPVRIGFANAREGSKHFYTRKIDVPDADRIHAVDRYWRMVESLGGDPGPKEFVLEEAIVADFGLVRAWKGDRHGNLVYRDSARNFNPLAAMCGRVTIAEVEHLVEPGEIDPQTIHTPGVFVQRVVALTPEQAADKRIERRTISKEA